MVDFSQIMARFVAAMVFGAIMGLERELAGKEAGVRTNMLVAGGSALFTAIALSLPFIISDGTADLSEVMARNGGLLSVIANIVVGVGFLGAGIIIKTPEHVHGLTTAALVWTTAAIGILSGIGMIDVAGTATILLSGSLYLLRRLNVSQKVDAARSEL